MNQHATSGKLQDTDLPALLASICGARQTGILQISRQDASKTIFVQSGRIIFATSNKADDRLGELLLRKGLLRIQHFEEASARLSQTKRLGALLVEMGHLRPEELVKAVIEQVKEIVFDVFLWSDGTYNFEQGELPTREVITLKLSTPEVIMGGIQRIQRWSRVLQGVGGLDATYQTLGGRDNLLHQMTLRTEHAALLQTLELPMSVRDLCRRGLLADFEVCKALWAFRVIGLIEPASMAPTAGATPQLEAVAQIEAPAATPAQAAAPPAAALEASAPVAAPPETTPQQPPAPPGAAAMTMAIPVLRPEPGAPAVSGAAGEDEPVLEVVEVESEPAAPPQAGATPPGGPAALDETQVETCLASFNERQRHFYSTLAPKAGDKTPEVVQRCLATMEKDLPGLFSGAAPDAEGCFDLETLKTNIFAFGVVGYATGLDMLIEREIEMAESMFGSAVRREISQALKAVRN